MSESRFYGLEAFHLAIFVKVKKNASNITKDDLDRILLGSSFLKEPPQLFTGIAGKIEDLQMLVKRFPDHKEAIRKCALTSGYFNTCMFEANDLYALVEMFPESRDKIYNLAMEKGFKYYAANNLDVYSDSPLELLFAAFPGYSDNILKDFHTRCHASVRPQLVNSATAEESDSELYRSRSPYLP